MKTSQNPSRGLAKFSRLRLTSKNNDAPASSSTNRQQISTEDFEENMSTSESSKSLDSPYKNSLTFIKYVPPVDDINDFKTPEPVKKISKICQAREVSLSKQTRTTQSRKKKSTKNKNTIFKITKDNFGQSDINPEHLQMALALSKSTYELENPEKGKDAEENLPCFLSHEKIAKVNTTLEKFGFKSDKPKIQPRIKRDIAEVSKRHKNSKFRFVTPTLQIRTPEEREEIITSKISLILNRNSSPPTKEVQNTPNENEFSSNLLKKYNKENIIFSANRLKLEETYSFNYYTKGLNITPTKVKCGHLLRNWEEILGRDKSPVREKMDRDENHLSNNCDKILQNCNKADFKDTDIRDKNVDFRKHSTSHSAIGKDKSPKINNDLNCDKKTEVANNFSKHNIEDRNCISPDLFASEDETDFTQKTPETDNVFSQSLLNLSPTKSQGLLKHNSRTASDIDSSQEAKLELSRRNLFKDDRGIQHFESYDDDFKTLSHEIYDLVQSSEDEDTEDLYLNSLKHNEKPAIRIDLTQESSSDKDTNQDSGILSNYNKQTEGLIGKAVEHADLRETESNFDMSPLLIKESNEFIQDISFRTNIKHSPKARELDLGCAQVSRSVGESPYEVNNQSPVLSRRSSRVDGLNSTTMLNVTAYVNQILNQDDEGTVKNEEENVDILNCSNNNQKYSNVRRKLPNGLSYEMDPSSFNEMALSHDIEVGNNCIRNECEDFDNLPDSELSLSQGSCSQESIIISDEELNYSSVYSKETKKENSVNSLSQNSCSQESIVISDDEINYSGASSRHTKSNKHFYHLSDTEEIGTVEQWDNGMDIEEANNAHTALKAKYGSQDISEPVHNRITELKRSSLTRKSLVKAVLEDSFNDLLEDTGILETIESGTKTIDTQKNKELTSESTNKENCENKCDNIVTPEKYTQIMPSTVKNGVTPDNNLIIKTDNITPMANYDEMDTPKVTKALQQFGLKPLKRQRGVKLLKYLYECTHPLVGPREMEELSSDEETHRKVKKKKKNNDTTNDRIDKAPLRQDRCDQDVEIVGDLLLKNENLEDLIFERKYSVKIPSCRIPLQIVWHNFVSKNPEIKENILLYEPLQLEVLHSMLKEQSGCKFHIQDLLTFFDKKCITVRTAQAQGGRRTRR